MIDRPIRVLLVDGHAEDTHWVCELVAEFHEARHSAGWMRGIEIFPTERLSDAMAVLGDAGDGPRFDAVLLNPCLPDSKGLHSYKRLAELAPDLPVVILSDVDDPDLALSLVRAGAQDFLVKTQIDAAPLARALRLAVERHRLIEDLRTLCWLDEALGVPNRTGFDLLAGLALRHAEQMGLLLGVIVIQIEGFQELARRYGKEETQIALVDVADWLRAAAGATAVVGRIAQQCFAEAFVALSESEAVSRLNRLRASLHRCLQSKANRSALGVSFGLATHQAGGGRMCAGGISGLLERAQAALCENKSSKPQRLKEGHWDDALACRAGRHL